MDVALGDTANSTMRASTSKAWSWANMVIAGQKAAKQASAQEVAEDRQVPEGHRADIGAGYCIPVGRPVRRSCTTEHLSLMNAMGGLPWALTFSYGRALQAAALQA